jgi:GWxTD domain-containing protein
MLLRLLLFAAVLLAAFAPAAPRPDYAGLYRDQPRLRLDTRREGDSLRLYLQVPAATQLLPGRPLLLTAWPGYEARQAQWQDSVPRRRWHPRPTPGGEVQLSFCLPVAQLPAGTVLQVQLGLEVAPEGYQDAGRTAWLRLTPERLSRSFILIDSLGQPLLRRYVRTHEVFGSESYGLLQPLRWTRYDLKPVPALPPMSDPRAVPMGPRILPILDSATTQPGQLLRFGQPGLYALKVGGAGGIAPRTVAVLSADNDYPALSTATELIEPLRFLTTSKERQALSSAPDPKRAVDQFWLDIAKGNKTLGKNLIRAYYGRVTAANDLFPAHKAGWLTDMGLLYIILGPPPSVRRLANGEERWFYPEAGADGGPITFTFRPKASTFAPDYYELVRRPEYELLWYAAVEQWRTPSTAPSAPADRRSR